MLVYENVIFTKNRDLQINESLSKFKNADKSFIDTFVICTMTGLTIVLSGAWDPSLKLEGVSVTVEAFSRGLSFIPCIGPFVSLFVMTSLAFFAFTTILGWMQCDNYITNRRKERH